MAGVSAVVISHPCFPPHGVYSLSGGVLGFSPIRSLPMCTSLSMVRVGHPWPASGCQETLVAIVRAWYQTTPGVLSFSH